MQNFSLIINVIKMCSLRSVFKLYGCGESLEELTEILKQYNGDEIVRKFDEC